MTEYPDNGVEYLRGIKDKGWRLASLENEKREYQQRCYSISSPNLSREKVDGGGIIHGLETKVEKIADYQTMIEAEYDALMADKMEARRALSLLDDRNSELFLKEYYVLNHSYKQICGILHCAKSVVQRSVKKGEEDFNKIYLDRVLPMLKKERSEPYRTGKNRVNVV